LRKKRPARYKVIVDMLKETTTVCRSIKTLFNFAPPATEEEIRAASLQFVRKLSGFTSPSMANRAAFDRAVAEVATSARVLIDALVTTAEPRDRAVEAERARARTAARFGARS
jgi:hypothetical protein